MSRATTPAIARRPAVAKAALKTKRPRRSNAERTSETRRKLFDASISCLHELGYAATSTNLVAERAGVSRGAMNHHFASKAELMVAVVEDVFLRDLLFYKERLDALPLKQRISGLIDLAWTAISGEGGQAVLHIMLAMQGDPELRSKLPPVINRIGAATKNDLHQMTKALGLNAKSRSLIDASLTLHLAALRGLAIESIIGGDPKNIEGALKLLHVYLDHLQSGLVSRA